MGGRGSSLGAGSSACSLMTLCLAWLGRETEARGVSPAPSVTPEPTVGGRLYVPSPSYVLPLKEIILKCKLPVFPLLGAPCPSLTFFCNVQLTCHLLCQMPLEASSSGLAFPTSSVASCVNAVVGPAGRKPLRSGSACLAPVASPLPRSGLGLGGCSGLA